MFCVLISEPEVLGLGEVRQANVLDEQFDAIEMLFENEFRQNRAPSV